VLASATVAASTSYSLFARTLLQFYWCQVGERGSRPESDSTVALFSATVARLPGVKRIRTIID
jgi:hypothetical protein